MVRNQHQTYDSTGRYSVNYPIQPQFHPGCPTNQLYATLPPSYPRRNTTVGPTSVKHIYGRLPGTVPSPDERSWRIIRDPLTAATPDNSLYSQEWDTYNKYGVKVKFGYMPYPLHHQSNWEVRSYGDVIPMLDIRELTRYQTRTE